MGVRFTITGHKQLDRKFAALPPKLQKKILRPALRAAAKIVLDQAKANAPVQSGRLKKSLKVKAAKRSRKTKHEVAINVITATGWFTGEAFYAPFQEFGWMVGPRRLGNRRKKQPGSRFIRRAYEDKGPQAIARALQLIRSGIEGVASGSAS